MKYINKKRLIGHFIKLVKILSSSGQEDEIRQVLVETLTNLGLQIIGDDYGNIIARLPGEGESLILCAHMDTVAIGRGKKITPERKGDIITSDGSTILGADNKDAVSAIIESLLVIKENGLPHRAVEVVFTREEEAISKGAKNLDYSRLSGVDCIIADSDEPFGTIIYGAPFCDRFDIRVVGERAHSKDPQKGVDVVKIIGRAFTTMPLGHIDEFTSSNIAYQMSGLNGEALSREVNLGAIPELLSREGEIQCRI